MKSLQYCQDRGKVGQNFISVKRDRVVTNLETFDLAIKTTEKRFYQKDYHISSDAQGLLLKSIKDNNNPHQLETVCNFYIKDLNKFSLDTKPENCLVITKDVITQQDQSIMFLDLPD